MPYRKTYRKKAPLVSSSRLGRRWYVDANIPKSVPFIGGSSFKAGSGTLTKRSLTQMIRATAESKQKIVAAQNTTNMTHNTLYTFNPFGNITIGTGQNGRLASSVFVKNWQVSALITNVGAGANIAHQCSWRVMVVNIENQYLSGLDTLTAGVGSTDIFVNGSSYMIDAHIDKNKCSVLYDQVHKVTPSHATQVTHARLNFDLSMNKQIKFLSPTSNYISGRNTYLIILPYLVDGTSGTTVAGTVQLESLVDFTDA